MAKTYVERDSDDTTICIEEQEAEQANVSARARRVILVNSTGDDVLVDDDGEVSTGTETLQVITLPYVFDGTTWKRVEGYRGADKYLSTYLTNGGSEDMSVDGSVTPVEFSYTVPAGKELFITRIFVSIEDGTVAFSPGDFGAGGALANGVVVGVTPNGGNEIVLETWKTNRQLRATMFDFDTEWKSDGAYVGRWTFGKDLGNQGVLSSGIYLSAGDKISVTINDDLTFLDFFAFLMKGMLRDI